ncbi:hypothetical protein [Intestinibacter sp.]|uniref:hypothetical protein n=1 Tax=Intestinibacter sp. TaxID=1965304 RepID=UPI003F145443
MISFIIGIVAGYLAFRIWHWNRVKFYVTKDFNGELRLFMCKPKRTKEGRWFATKEGVLIATEPDFGMYGIDLEEYRDIDFDTPTSVTIKVKDGKN